METKKKKEIKEIDIIEAMMVVMALMANRDFPDQLDRKVNQEVPHLLKKT